MLEIHLLLIAIIAVALIFDFTNGAHDSANAIATIVSTKVLKPKTAVLLAAVLNLGGALLGTEVAKTIGGGVVNPELVMGSHILVLAALLGAIFWNLLTWRFGLPSSSSHALIGGLIGAALADGGWNSLGYATILNKILLPLVLSPAIGFAGGYCLMVTLCWLLARARPSLVNRSSASSRSSPRPSWPSATA